MTVLDDTIKGTTLGDPDGPAVFVESLDCEVPTFVDPRLDLIPPGRGNAKVFQRLDYHVPFAMRGDFRPEQWPKSFRDKHKGVRITTDGFVICSGVTKGTGQLCGSRAVNRTLFCRNHGGALHPADKKMSGHTIAPMPLDRIENLDRTQKFMQGLLSVEDLDDDEITGSFVRTNDGAPIKSRVLGKKFEQIIAKELHARLNRYLMQKTPRALEVLYEIIDSDLVEPADRLKAIQMLTDRTLGKAADVLITHTSEEKPYESIIERVVGGSREDYRKSVTSTRAEIEVSGTDISAILDAEEVDFEEPDDDAETQFDMERPDEVRLGGIGATGEGVSNGWDRNDEGERIPDTKIDLGEDTGDKKYDAGFLAAAEAKKKAAVEARERIKKARSRRFAKRAVSGISDIGDDAFLLEFKVIADPKSPLIGKYKMKMHRQENVTPALLAKVQLSNSQDLLDLYAAPPAVELGSKPLDYHNGKPLDQEK